MIRKLNENVIKANLSVIFHRYGMKKKDSVGFVVQSQLSEKIDQSKINIKPSLVAISTGEFET